MINSKNEFGGENNMDVRDNLKKVISDKGFIQASIAKKAGISPCKLSAILSKSRKLEANEMFDLCEAMEISPCELKDYASNHRDEKGK